MTSSNGNPSALLALCAGNSPVTGLTKASDGELWCFRWSAPKQTNEQTIETLGIWDAIALSTVMNHCWLHLVTSHHLVPYKSPSAAIVSLSGEFSGVDAYWILSVTININSLSLVRHLGTWIWVNIGSGNGLLPDGTKPLPEPMLTYHQ